MRTSWKRLDSSGAWKNCVRISVGVQTDSNVLRWLTQKKEVNGKFARWIMALQEYSFDIRHIRGKSNVTADALFRAPVGLPEATCPTERIIAVLQSSGYSSHELELFQHGDDEIHKKMSAVQGFATEEEKVKCQEKFKLYRGVLYKRNFRSGRPYMLVVPSNLRCDILDSCHDDPTGGHLGVEKTLAKLSQRYWWFGVSKSLEVYVRSCAFCQLHNSRQGRQFYLLVSLSTRLGWIILPLFIAQ